MIAEETVIYAKWWEDTTPGASIKHAYALAFDSQDLYDIEKDQTVYFAYTATEEGRYTLAPGGGVYSPKCTYKTNVTGEEIYGKDCDKDEITVDLDKGQRLVVLLTCDEELPADAKVSVVLTHTTDEPLPEGAFLSGNYCDSIYMFTIDREHKEVSYIEPGRTSPTVSSFSYIGGKFDYVYFVSSTTNMKYRLQRGNSGAYRYMYENDRGQTIKRTLLYLPQQEAIAIDKFAGTYEFQNGSTANGITKIVIYEDGSGYYINNSVKQDQERTKGAIYDSEHNILTFGSCTICLNTEEGNVVGISVITEGYDGLSEYTRTGDPIVIPTSLPIGDDDKYYGETYAIICMSGSQYWQAAGSSGVRITDFADDTYTVVFPVRDAADMIFKLKIEGEGDNTVIKLYNEAGTTLVDTLHKFVIVYHDLPDSATSQTLQASDFQNNFYFFKYTAADDAYYTFTVSAGKVYYAMNAGDPTLLDQAKSAGTAEVKLTQNMIVGVYIGDCATKPDSVTFTAQKVDSPAGLSSDNPLILVNGSATLAEMNNTGTYYFRYTAPAAGTYAVCFSYADMTRETVYRIHYTINGTNYGYQNYKWVGGVTQTFPYAIITLSDDLVVNIAADRAGGYPATVDTVKVVVMQDRRVDAERITEDSGTISDDSFALGVTDVENIHLTSATDFTVAYLNETYTGKDVFLTPADMALGFTVTGTADFAVNYIEGSQKNPVIITEVGTTSVNVESYVTVTAPADTNVKLSLGSVAEWNETIYFYFVYNNEEYGYKWDDNAGDYGGYTALSKTSLAIAKGQSVTIQVLCDGYYEDTIPVIVAVDFTVGAVTLEFTQGTPSEGEIVATATAPGEGTYHIADELNAEVHIFADAAFTVTTESGRVTEAELSEGEYVVTVYVSEGLYFNIQAATTQSYTFRTVYIEGTNMYPKAIVLQNKTATLDVRAGYVVFFSLPAGFYKVTAAYAGSYVYHNGQNVLNSSAFEVKEGDKLSAVADRRNDTTFTIQEADAIEVPEELATYKGSYHNGSSNITLILKVNTDFTKGEYTVDDPNDSSMRNEITLSQIETGVYTFNFANGPWMDIVTVTVVSDTSVKVVVDGYYTATLTKQA